MRRRPAHAARWLALLACWAQAGAAGAQQLELQAARGPHYVDVPVEIRIVADGFEEEPTPEAVAPEPAAGTLELLDVSPQVSSSGVIAGGALMGVLLVFMENGPEMVRKLFGG